MPKYNIESITLPYVPPQVDLKDLQPNGMLSSALPTRVIGGKEYIEYKELGSGAFGSVHLLQGKEDKRVYAMKKGGPMITGDLHDRIDLMEGKPVRFLPVADQNDNVPEFKKLVQLGLARQGDYFVEEFKRKNPQTGEMEALEDQVRFNFLMDYKQGYDLKKFVQKRESSPAPLAPVRLMEIVLRSVECVATFHRKGFLHRDIKPENMMLNQETGEVSLVDLGLAIAVQGGKSKPGQEEHAGTPGYIAPELAEKKRVYSTASDVYALGVTLKKMFGQDAFGAHDEKDILKHHTPFADDPLLIEMLDLMTDENPEKRPTMKKVEEFFSSFYEELLVISHEMEGLLDIGDYFSSDPAKKEQFIAALIHMDSVVLVNNLASNGCIQPDDPEGELKLIQIRRELEDKGIFVRANVVTVPNSQELANLPAYLREEKGQNDQVIRGHFHFSSNPHQPSAEMRQNGICAITIQHSNSKEYAREMHQQLSHQQVPQNERARVQAFLKDEKARLLEKYNLKENHDPRKDGPLSTKQGIALDRLKVIERRLAVLSNKTSITYTALFEMLNATQRSMRATSGLYKFFGIQSRGAKKTSELLASLKNADARAEAKKELKEEVTASSEEKRSAPTPMRRHSV